MRSCPSRGVRSLQWGRSRSGAEDDRSLPGGGDPGRPPDSLQWGRSRSGAEDVQLPGPSATGRTSFNGAAPGRERKTPAWPAYRTSATSFNGAAPGRERKTQSRRIPWTISRLLQWGRSRSGAEDSRIGRLAADDRAASMGPLPVGSGRRQGRGVLRPAGQASMGPLPVGSGRLGGLYRRRDHEGLASMGPLPVGSGRPGSFSAEFGTMGSLQWGRSRSGAEDAGTAPYKAGMIL